MTSLHIQWMEPMDEFFKRIDSLGGWPIGVRYVVMRHCCDLHRPCYFTDKYQHDEWNTTVCSSDDYYWWKVTKDKKEEIRRDYFSEFKKLVQRIT